MSLKRKRFPIEEVSSTEDISATAKFMISEYLRVCDDITLEGMERELAELYVDQRVYDWPKTYALSAVLNLAPTQVQGAVERNRVLNKTEVLALQERRYRLVMLVAPIGSGKSTFLAHLLRVDLPKLFPGVQAHTLIFRGLDQSTEYSEFLAAFREDVHALILRAFPCFRYGTMEEYRRTVHPLLCSLFRDQLLQDHLTPEDPGSDEELYRNQVSLLQRIRSTTFARYCGVLCRHGFRQDKNVRLVVVMDNLDQHLPYFPRNKAILDTVGIVREMQSTMFVPLRDSSLRSNVDYNAIASFQTLDLIVLRPPAAAAVLSRRVDWLKTLVSRREESDERDAGVYLLDSLRDGVTKRDPLPKGPPVGLVSWIEKVPNNNLREMLRTIGVTLKSRHLFSANFERLPRNVDELSIAREGIHVNKIKRAFLLGASPYFLGDQAPSNVVNLFCSASPTEPCNNIFRIKLLQWFALEPPPRRLRPLIEFLDNAVQERGSHMVRNSLLAFIGKGLLTCHGFNDEGDPSEVREVPITLEGLADFTVLLHENGLCHLSSLLFDTYYPDEMKFSTFIDDRDFENIFRHFLREGRPLHEEVRPGISLRLRSTMSFLRYIERAERSEAGTQLGNALSVPPIMDAVVRYYQDYIDKMLVVFKAKRRLEGRDTDLWMK